MEKVQPAPLPHGMPKEKGDARAHRWGRAIKETDQNRAKLMQTYIDVLIREGDEKVALRTLQTLFHYYANDLDPKEDGLMDKMQDFYKHFGQDAFQKYSFQIYKEPGYYFVDSKDE